MTQNFIGALRDSGAPTMTAIESNAIGLSRSEVQERVEQLAIHLQELNVSGVALYLDNGVDWVIADLACQLATISTVPLPLFFSTEQVRHAVLSGGVDAVITDRDLTASLLGAEPTPACDHFAAGAARIYRLQPNMAALLPPGTQKITFTSGTTGTPKGVCLSADQQFTLASSLAAVINVDNPTHLCVLPLSTLLENLAGIYAPLLASGKVIAPPLADVGLDGSSGLNIHKLLASISQHQPNTLILVPEILNAITLAAAAGWQPPASLQFVAVGGGKVSPELLLRARSLGIPAYEGYGLSECSSVVCLNVAAADQAGSVGRPLPHVKVTTIDGEIIVSGSTFLGYANQPDSWGADAVHTGDIGHIGDDGFVHVNGRLKHQLITSFGRNLSPEWVESELLAGPLLQQAVVVGDDRPYCVALIYPRDVATTDQDIQNWINTVNIKLPDYARIANWYRLPTALNTHDGLLTENGRPKRNNIEQTYQPAIGELYETRQEVSNL